MFTVICHCRMCQQWTGTPIMVSAAFDRETLSFTKGVPKHYQSSSVCERGYCAHCGSSLFTRYSTGGAFDTVIFISLGTLDDPEIGEPDIHDGAKSEISGMHREDGLPRIRIDVDDPAEQNALFDRLIADAADRTNR